MIRYIIVDFTDEVPMPIVTPDNITVTFTLTEAFKFIQEEMNDRICQFVRIPENSKILSIEYQEGIY